MKIFLCIFMLSIFTGCGLKNIDKPPPSQFERWNKTDESRETTKQGLQECGYSDATWTIEQQHKVDECMLNKGYNFIDEVRGMRRCDHEPYQDLPSCQSLGK
jgi:hypothetical protein